MPGTHLLIIKNIYTLISTQFIISDQGIISQASLALHHSDVTLNLEKVHRGN